MTKSHLGFGILRWPLLVLFLLCGLSWACDTTPAGDDATTPADDDDAPTPAPTPTSQPTPTAPAFQNLVEEVSGNAEILGMDATRSNTGDIYISWIEFAADSDLKVVRSTDNGSTFSAAVSVPIDAIAVTGWEESRPRIAADGDRVAVAFTNIEGTAIWVSIADVAATLVFGAPIVVSTTFDGPNKNGFQSLTFASNGELWVTWSHVLGAPPVTNQALRVFASRESEAWQTRLATDETNGRPCNCCGTNLTALASGEVLLVMRGMDVPRNQFVVRHPGDASVGWTSIQASTTNWNFAGCPENPPVIAQAPTGEVQMAWSDSSSGDSRTWFVTSNDGGLTWVDQRMMDNSGSGAQTSPLLAIQDDGLIRAGWTMGTAPQLASSSDGQIFTGYASLQVPAGSFRQPRVLAGANTAYAVGVVGQQLWLIGLP